VHRKVQKKFKMPDFKDLEDGSAAIIKRDGAMTIYEKDDVLYSVYRSFDQNTYENTVNLKTMES